MLPRLLIALLGLVTILSFRAPLHAQAGSLNAQPNIVFFLVDDLGFGDLGYSGSALAETPNIDTFARENLIFSSAYASSPHCSPTRASIVTGQYPARLHITVWIGGKKATSYKNLGLPTQKQFLARDVPTVAEYFQTRGYTTAQFGKWHVGGNRVPLSEHGFDKVIGWGPGAGPGNWFAPYNRIKDLPGPEGEYITDRLTDEAIEFMAAQEDEPFFLLLQHYDVHAPLAAPEETVQKYFDRGRPLDKGKENATFLAMKERTDASFGRIVEALDQLGLSDNTIVIFFSDNGGVSYFANNGGLRGGKKFLYEGGIRVPLVMRVPGLTRAGTISNVPVNAVDFFPTLVELTGSSLGSVDAPLDGVSLKPLLENKPLNRDAMFWHMPQLGKDWTVIPPQGAVRVGPWKLLHHYGETKPDELYNLDEDYGETNNLAKQHPKRVQAMRLMLEQHLAETKAQTVTIR